MSECHITEGEPKESTMPRELTNCKVSPKINTHNQALETSVPGDTALDFSFTLRVLTDTMTEQYCGEEYWFY